MSSTNYPKNVETAISEIVQVTQRKEEEVREILDEIVNDPKVNKMDFVNDEDRYLIYIRMLKVRTVMTPADEEATIIPIGCAGIRITKDGSFQDKITALVKLKEKKTHLAVIMCMRDSALLTKNIVYYSQYEERIQVSKNGTYYAGSGTTFKKPIAIGKSPQEIWKSLKFKEITIKDVSDNLARKRSDGYSDELDLRVIRGTVGRSSAFKRKKDNTPAAVITIIDDTVDITAQVDAKKGHGLTVWYPDSQPLYPQESDCRFLGVLGADKEGNVTMNGIYADPIWVP